MTAVYDSETRFLGHEPNEGCEHRSTGGRAWCLSCTEWCYPAAPCVRCERAISEANPPAFEADHSYRPRSNAFWMGAAAGLAAAVAAACFMYLTHQLGIWS